MPQVQELESFDFMRLPCELFALSVESDEMYFSACRGAFQNGKPNQTAI